MKLAHQQDITLNQLVEQILREAIAKHAAEKQSV
jgi:predicted HicB family RNase H-like nuclease